MILITIYLTNNKEIVLTDPDETLDKATKKLNLLLTKSYDSDYLRIESNKKTLIVKSNNIVAITIEKCEESYNLLLEKTYDNTEVCEDNNSDLIDIESSEKSDIDKVLIIDDTNKSTTDINVDKSITDIETDEDVNN